MCRSSSVEDVHYFLFDCSAYTHTRGAFAALFHTAVSTAGTLALVGRHQLSIYDCCVPMKHAAKESKVNVGRKADLEDSCGACNFPALHSEDGRLSWQPEACNVQTGSDKAPRVVAQVQNERITPTLLHS